MSQDLKDSNNLITDSRWQLLIKWMLNLVTVSGKSDLLDTWLKLSLSLGKHVKKYKLTAVKNMLIYKQSFTTSLNIWPPHNTIFEVKTSLGALSKNIVGVELDWPVTHGSVKLVRVKSARVTAIGAAMAKERSRRFREKKRLSV